MDVPDRRVNDVPRAHGRKHLAFMPSRTSENESPARGWNGSRHSELPSRAQHPRQGVLLAQEPAWRGAVADRRGTERAPELGVERVASAVAAEPHGVGGRAPGSARLEQQSCEPDRVAADILDRSPRELGEHADVLRVVEPEMEARIDLAHLSDRSFGEQRTDAGDLLVEREYERLPQRSGRVRADRQDRRGLLGVAHSGFSQNTALPASSAATVHSACRALGNGM